VGLFITKELGDERNILTVSDDPAEYDHEPRPNVGGLKFACSHTEMIGAQAFRMGRCDE
jgi:hypothetical protein